MQPVGVGFATLAGPWGPFQVAATTDGLVAADIEPSRGRFEESVAGRFGAIFLSDAATKVLDDSRPILELLIGDARVDSGRLPLDLSDRSAFDRRVLLAVRDIPWGRTASYGEVARRVGSPRAARAVGSAVGRNPLSLVIPCHRVIAADGTLGGYGGDGPAERADALERKRRLLLREGITVGFRDG
jgi:methylated-DNA-[protein]-cysteine S-methyltransferase